jgi:TP901 family phage tail tape measure protein
MALDAGEVYVVCGARLDAASIAKSRAAFKSLEGASNDYQRAIDRGAKASDRLHEANQRWQRAAIVGAKASAIGIGTVAAALTGAAVAAASFDASMRNVNSIASLSEKQFKALEARVLNLSTAVGKSPKELADGLYSIVSSGFKANDAMKILTAGARAARAGLTDTASATGALTSVLNAYGLKAGDARKVSDVLFQTVNVGVLNFQQLAGALGKVLSPAASIGVSLKDLTGAMAALTLRGNSADEAATQLGQTMLAFQKPGPALTKILKGLGYESGTAAIKAVGFKGSLDEVVKAATKAGVPLAQLFSNVRALRGVQGLEGTAHAAAVFTSSVKAMDDATKGAGETAKVYAEQQKSTAAQFDNLKAAVDVAAVTIGASLLPMINQGITALTGWFAEAQKSGDITRWANEIATGVSEVVTFLHSLGPAAATAFHVISSTIQAAIPFVQTLYKIFQTLEPAISDVAHAASGLVGALGPAPILAAVAAFVLLRRATLTGQAAMGTFSKIMQAGTTAIGTAGGGIEITAGKFNKVGTEAVKSASFAKIAAQGIASSFGPQLIAVGAAGIILGLVAIASHMTTLKDEANDVVNAMLHLNDVRLGRQSAALDVRAAQRDVTKARATAGSAAVAVATARAVSAATPGGHPNIADPAVTAALSHQADVILDLQQKTNRLAEAQTRLGHANTALNKGSQDLSRQYVGFAQHADGFVKSQQAAEIWSGKVRDTVAEATQKANLYADSISKQAREADGATRASIRTADGIAGIVRQMGHLPDKKTTDVIVNGLKAGRSVAEIRAALVKLGLLHPKIPVTADTKDANRDIDNTSGKVKALDALTPTVHLGASGFDAVNAAIAGVNTNILHLTSKPFTVNIAYATGKAPPLPGVPAPKKRATGGKATGPEIGVWGEDGPEYLIPVGAKHKAAGIALWLAAGKDLGIPGYAAGKSPAKKAAGVGAAAGRKPPKPKPVHFAAFPVNVYDQREKSAHNALDADRRHAKTVRDDEKSLNHQLTAAHDRVTKAKTAKTRASALKDEKALRAKIEPQLITLRAEEAAAKASIAADTLAYQEALRVAKAAREYAAQIKRDQDEISQATSEMTLASDRWSATKNPTEKAAQLKAYGAAAQRRSSGNKDLQRLLQEAQAVIKDKGSQYFRDNLALITGAQIDDVAATDPTQDPGYVDPNVAPSTDINDYLYPEEQAALAAAALEEARASATDDTADDVVAAQDELGAANWIANRLQQDNAPPDILIQAYNALASAKSNLTSALQGNTPSGATSGVTADQQAALDQQTARATAAEAQSASDRAALQTYQQSGDLIRGGATVVQNFSMLTPGSGSQQRQIATEVSKALGAQGSVPTTTGFYNG